jgi:GTP-binding protein Era
VSRDTQKQIVVGKGGAKIKELGIKARVALEKFLDRKVYLGLTVRVDKDWRQNDDSLVKYGYLDRDWIYGYLDRDWIYSLLKVIEE